MFEWTVSQCDTRVTQVIFLELLRETANILPHLSQLSIREWRRSSGYRVPARQLSIVTLLEKPRRISLQLIPASALDSGTPNNARGVD